MKKLIPVTQRAIDNEIAALKKLKPLVRKITAFGDNNHDAIDAQIEVLEKKLTDQQIDDLSWFSDEPEEERDDRWSPHTHDSAMQVHNWMIGYDKEPPSKGWAPLAKAAGLR